MPQQEEQQEPSQEEINQTLAKELINAKKEIETLKEIKHQELTATQPKDDFDKPLTLRTAINEFLPPIMDLLRQFKQQQNPPDPMQSVYLEFGKKVVSDTLEQLSKNVFAKPIAKDQIDRIKNATSGVQ